MAKGIKTQNGNVFVSKISELTGASGLFVGFEVSATTQNIFNWGTAYLNQTASGGYCYISGKDYSGENLDTRSSAIAVGEESQVYIFCFTDDLETSCTVVYQWTSDPDAAAQNIKNNNIMTYGEVLYLGSTGILVDLEEWDQSPSTDENDPLNLEARGGAFADLGDFSQTDLIGLGDLPDPETLAFDFGSFLTCYCANQTNINIVGRSIFVPDFWTALGQKFTGLSDPLSCIVSAVLLPFESVGSGAAAPFKLGGVQVYDGFGDQDPISLPKIPTVNRYRAFGLGGISLKEVWGTEKDYSKTSIQIYLPYVGVKDIDPDIVINTTVSLQLYLDTWTGDIMYIMHTSNASSQSKYFRSDAVVYRWAGNCGIQLPCGRVDMSEKLLKIASGIGGMAAGIATGNPQTIVGGAQAMMNAGFSNTVQSSTGIDSAFGRMDLQYPYLIIKRGVPEYPNGWRSEIGAPRLQTFKGSQCTGFTLFQEIHLDGLPYATKEETEELTRELCTEGIIF